MARILIADDHLDAGEALARFFTKAGHEVTVTANGRLALLHVIAQTPDVVLLDLLMPEMDGPSFLEVVRSYLRLQSLPVVVLTGLPEGPLAERTKLLNVDSILTKANSSSTDVLKAIETALARVRC